MTIGKVTISPEEQKSMDVAMEGGEIIAAMIKMCLSGIDERDQAARVGGICAALLACGVTGRSASLLGVASLLERTFCDNPVE